MTIMKADKRLKKVHTFGSIDIYEFSPTLICHYWEGYSKENRPDYWNGIVHKCRMLITILSVSTRTRGVSARLLKKKASAWRRPWSQPSSLRNKSEKKGTLGNAKRSPLYTEVGTSKESVVSVFAGTIAIMCLSEFSWNWTWEGLPMEMKISAGIIIEYSGWFRYTFMTSLLAW